MVPSWIFIHGTNIVDRGLKVPFLVFFLLFFGLFPCPLPPSWKRLNSAIFGLFAVFWPFFRCPPPLEIFSADALECKYRLKKPLRKALQDTAALAKTNLYKLKILRF